MSTDRIATTTILAADLRPGHKIVEGKKVTPVSKVGPCTVRYGMGKVHVNGTMCYNRESNVEVKG